jgi:hypothetical protein
MHWLAPRRRQVEDGQAAMGEGEPGLLVDPDATIVGATMPETIAHGQRDALQSKGRASGLGINEPR